MPKLRGATITIDGLDELRRQMADLSAAGERAVLRTGLQKGAQRMRKEIRDRAPVGPTKRLKRGIDTKVRVNPQRAYALVGPRKGKGGAPHAHLVEFGHVMVVGGRRGKGGRIVGFVPARPFMRPAFDAAKEDVERIIADEMRAAIDKVRAKGGRYVRR